MEHNAVLVDKKKWSSCAA